MKKIIWCLMFSLIAVFSSMAQVEKVELYRFRAPGVIPNVGDLYKPGASLPPGLDGHKLLGPVFLVPKNDGQNVHPIYISSLSYENAFVKDGKTRISYYYSRLAAAPKRFSPGGIAFYVSSVPLPGTVLLYGFSKITGIDENGTATLSYRFKTDAEKPGPDWEEHGHMGYVWPLGSNTLNQQISLLHPDLRILKTSVLPNGIETWIVNDGKIQISSDPGVSAELQVYDRDGKKLVFSSGAKRLGGMSGGQRRPIVFDTGKLDLERKYYRIKVDAANLVAESNENNNDTGQVEIPGPKVDLSKIKPLPAGYVPPPTINLASITPAGGGRTNYSIAVTNAANFDPLAFQSLENILPPNPCGRGNTNARMVARVAVIKTNPVLVACKPLNSRQDLASLEFTFPAKLDYSDRLKIYVEDRATKDRWESGEFTVGWFGVDKVLVPSGCKYFLGRAGQYLCTTDQGYKTCEGLRAQGKPIQCRRSGK
jgi:hypothetical protein